MTDPITPKLANRQLCFTDGSDILCESPSPYLTSGGLLGIGTTDPQTALEVSGTVSATAFVGDGSGLTNLSASGDRITSGTTSVVANTNGAISFTTAGTERMVVTSAGNVGVGTADPSATLHVNGASGIRLSHPSGAGGYFTDIVQNFTGNDPFYISTNNYGRALGIKKFGALSGAQAYISGYYGVGFATSANNPTESNLRMFISQAGNVGIGTVTPTVTLQVSGSFTVSTSAQTTTPSLYVGADGKVGIGMTASATSKVVIRGDETDSNERLTTWQSGNGWYVGELIEGGGAGVLKLGYAGVNTTYVRVDGGDNSNNPGISIVENGNTNISLRSNEDSYFRTRNVGIGTTTPSATLHVSGTARITSWTAVAANVTPTTELDVYGTISATNILVNGTPVTGTADRITSGTTSAIATQDRSVTITTAGTQRIVIGENGYVGIGTSTPSGNLNVVNGGYSTNIGSGQIHSTAPAGLTTLVRMSQTGVADWVISNLAASGRLRISSGNGADFNITNGGNVGIGTNAPAATLHVSGSFTVSTSAQSTTPSLYVGTDGNVGIGRGSPIAKLDISSGNNSGGQWGGNIALGYYANGGYRHWISTKHNSVDNSGNALEFYLNNATTPSGSSAPGTSNTMVLGLYGPGNVGIGTTNPDAKLDVYGTISATNILAANIVTATYFEGDGSRLTGIASGTADNLGNHTATQALDMAGYAINAAGTVSGTAFYSGDGNAYFYNNGSIPSLVFDTNDYFRFTRSANTLDWLVGGNAKFTVDSTGKLGVVGNGDPQAALDATGGIVSATTYYGSNGTVSVPAYSFSNDTNSGIYRAAAAVLGFSVGSANVVSISSGGIGTTGLAVAGNVTATGVISASGFVIGANSPAATGAVRYNGTSDTLQVYTGSGWRSLVSGTSGASALSGLSDVTISNVAGRDYLRYDAGASKWVNISESTVMSTTSMVSGWPDAILCNITSPNWGATPLYLTHAPDSGGNFYYRVNMETGTPYSIAFSSSGAFSAYQNLTTTDCNTSVSALYAAGKAFNFIGGGASTGAGTAASSTGAIQFNSGGSFAGDTSNLFWDDANNRLGIGTSAPLEAIAISTTGANGLSVRDRSPTAYSQIVFYGTSRTLSLGIGNSAAPQGLSNKFFLFDATSATTRLAVDAIGNVGIGTVTPTAHLDVSGNISATNAIQVGTSSLPCSAGIPGAIRYNAGSLEYCNGTVWADLVSGTAGNVTGTGSANHVAFWSGANTLTYDSSQLYWDATNNRLGIGTASPGTNLGIAGSVSATGNLNVAGRIGIATSAVAAVPLEISGTENIRLVKTGGGSNPYVSWYNDGSRQGYMGYGTKNSDFDITTENGTRLDLTGANGIALTATAGEIAANDRLIIASNARMTGATSNSIAWSTIGVAAPGAGSAGMKLQLYGGTSNIMATSDYALGIEGGNLWLNTGGGIKFYAGSTLRAEMASTGTISATAFHASNGDSAAAPGHTWIGDVNTGIFHPVADVIGVSINGTERSRIFSTGISTTGVFYAGNGSTATPAFNFHSDLNTGMYRAGTDIIGFSTNGVERARIVAGGISTSGVYYSGNGTAAAPAHTFSGDTNNGMFLATTDALGLSTAGTERMRIAANGRVGIGVTVPTAELSVAGSLDTTGNGTFGGFDFRLGNADQSTRGDSGASRALVKYSGAVLGINWGGDFTGGTVVAGYGNSNNLYVSGAANGNVGIGTASPADRLHLDNTDNTYVRIDGGNGYMGVKLTDDGVLKWQIYNSGGTSDRFYVVDKDTNNGVYINQDASAWTANSDRRLKTNIQDYSVLDKIDNGFRAVTFDWKSGGKRDFGVVAQEIYKAFPEVVDKGTDDLEKTISDTTDKSVWGVKYDRLGVLALEGVRELKAENDKLHRLLKAANDNDAALRQQLDELRHDLRELKRAQHAD